MDYWRAQDTAIDLCGTPVDCLDLKSTSDQSSEGWNLENYKTHLY